VFLTSTVDEVKVLKMLKQLVTRPGSHCDMRPSWIITDYHKTKYFRWWNGFTVDSRMVTFQERRFLGGHFPGWDLQAHT